MQREIQEIICPICMTVFRKPVTISCGHTFCYSCLNNSTRDHRNCPICRQHISSTPNRIRTDQSVQRFIQHFQATVRTHQQKRKIENIHIQCKPERLLLIDILTEDLLLPYNKITATFQLQSNLLIDRMDRFVARQQIPFNNYSVICRMVHIKQLRKNQYQGVIEGKAFCNIETQEIQSQISVQFDEEEFFYRTCKSKEISETSDTNVSEYNSFFMNFNRLEDGGLKKLIYQKIDPNIFAVKNDSVGIFYSILGIIDMDMPSKYKLATSFNEEQRIQQIKNYMSQVGPKISSNPSAFIKISSTQTSSDKKVMLFFIILFFLFLFSKSQNSPDL